MEEMRMAFCAFDLFAGLSNQEIINLSGQSMFFTFIYLMACVWLSYSLKKP